MGTAGISAGSAIFFDNAAYMGHGRKLSRIDLDGTVTELPITPIWELLISTITSTVAKWGSSWTADTQNYYNAVNIEVDAAGRVLKEWKLATIISAAMIAGGDDPSQFVYTSANRLVP